MISRTAAANATAVVVRNGATLIKNIKVEQRASAAAALFLQIFNTNAPTVGITAPVEVHRVTAGDASLILTFSKVEFQGMQGGFKLDTGFSYAVTTTPTGSTNPTAGQEPVVEIHYEQLGA